MHQIGNLLSEVEPPPYLYTSIQRRIETIQRHRARIRIATFIGTTLLSVGGLISSISYMTHELYVSGFYDYLSLAFSDHRILSSWKMFGLLLFDSLPALAILGVLVCASMGVWALSRIPYNARIAFSV